MLQIESAVYRTANYEIDVTGILRGHIKGNIVNITVSNDLFGEPEYGVVKDLFVTYTLDGVVDVVTVVENEKLLLPHTSERFVDIIVPTYNNDELTSNCFKTIKKFTKPGSYRVIWVDNGSKDMTRSMKEIEDIKHRKIFLDKNEGFVGAINKGLSVSYAPLVCLLNNDTMVTPGWLDKLTNCLLNNKDFGIVGPFTGFAVDGNPDHPDSQHSLELHAEILPPDARQWTFHKINEELERLHSGGTYPVSFVAFLCALIKREVINAVGYLDTQFEMGMWDDLDYNRSAMKAGYKVALAIDTCIYHRGRSTFNVIEKTEKFDVPKLLRENREKLDKKWQ